MESRKEPEPKNNAFDLAAAMSIELLTEEQYQALQPFGPFDTKTSSWVKTPPEIRKLGGALFVDLRYAQVFVYHNSAPSYYAATGIPWLAADLNLPQTVSNIRSSAHMTSGNYIFKTNLRKRIFATLLDYGVFIVYLYLYAMFVGHDTDEGGMKVTGLPCLAVPAVWFIYFVVVEAVYGGTFGHQALELKVLTIDRKEIGFSEAIRRRLLDIIDLFFYGIPAIIAINASDTHQRLGDMWAGTIVVDTGDPEQYGDGKTSVRDGEEENYRQRTFGS